LARKKHREGETMWELDSFLFGFWAGGCFIITIWGIYLAGKQSAKKAEKA